MILNNEQQVAVRRVRVADQALRHEKASAKSEELEAAHLRIEDRIRDRLIERDKAAARADLLGVPRAQIAQLGMSTTNTRDARAAIAHGLELLGARGEIEAEDQDGALPTSPQVAGGVVTLTPEDLEPFAKFVGSWTIPQSAEFELHDGAVRPVGADDDAVWSNPVVQVVMGPDASWRERVKASLIAGDQ